MQLDASSADMLIHLGDTVFMIFHCLLLAFDSKLFDQSRLGQTAAKTTTVMIDKTIHEAGETHSRAVCSSLFAERDSHFNDRACSSKAEREPNFVSVACVSERVPM